ncbi:MAG: winged helix-turn-helix transcriptional regulator [Thermoplasmata archaeon]
MDSIDKDILVFLLRDGRYSKSKIAEEMGLSPQFINYRIKRMIQNSIIKDFKMHLNPYYFNAKSIFLAFEGSANSITEETTSIFKCLEKLYFFELQGKNLNALEQRIKKLVRENGELKMKYIPKAPLNITSLVPADLKILSVLKDQPISSVYEISKATGVSSGKIKKRLEIMKNYAVFSIVPIIDLSKVDLFIYAIITKDPSALNMIKGSWILRIMDDNAGIFVSVAYSISEIKNNLEKAKKVDRDTEVMMIYDYDFIPNIKLLS